MTNQLKNKQKMKLAKDLKVNDNVFVVRPNGEVRIMSVVNTTQSSGGTYGFGVQNGSWFYAREEQECSRLEMCYDICDVYFDLEVARKQMKRRLKGLEEEKKNIKQFLSQTKNTESDAI